jgi:hypothetical protein
VVPQEVLGRTSRRRGARGSAGLKKLRDRLGGDVELLSNDMIEVIER